MDWTLVVLLLAFTIRGLLRGTVAQVFAFFGLIAGLWAAAAVAGWVEVAWQGARPAIVFQVLRWLVAGLAGLALVSLFQWSGGHVSKAARESPFGWLDRLVGGAVGAATGLLLGALVVLTIVQMPLLAPARGAVVAGVAPRPLLTAAAWAAAGARTLPGGAWLDGQFRAAERRLARSSSRHAS